MTDATYGHPRWNVGCDGVYGIVVKIQKFEFMLSEGLWAHRAHRGRLETDLIRSGCLQGDLPTDLMEDWVNG